MQNRALSSSHDAKPSAFQNPSQSWNADLDSLPTVETLANGSRRYWSVPKAGMEVQKDLAMGEKLARQTLSQLRAQSFPPGILSRILQQAPRDCLIATGFRHLLERELLD